MHALAVAMAATLLAPLPGLAQTAAVPEVATAARAVERASQADADQYAPELLYAARGALSKAQAAQASRSSRDRRQAAELAVRATLDADLARARSEEAAINSRLQQRRDDLDRLRASLGTEGRP